MSTEPEQTALELRREYGFPDSPTVYETKRWVLQELFLTAYPKCNGGVYKAADQAGCTARAHENWLQSDSFGYQKRFLEAEARYVELVVGEAHRRGIDGIDKPIYYKGVRVDTIKEYSDNLLMFIAKKRDPSYRDNYTLVIDMPDDIRQWFQARQAADSEARAALPEAGPVIDAKPAGPPPWETE